MNKVSSIGLIFAWAAACIIPYLWSITIAPSATLLNQVWCGLGWGLIVAFAGKKASPRSIFICLSRVRVAIFLLLALIAASILSAYVNNSPRDFALLTSAILVGALIVLIAGTLVHATPGNPVTFQGFAWALVSVASINAVLGGIQLLFPDALDGYWLLLAPDPSRAAGNIRQPNLFALLLLWGLILTLWLQFTVPTKPARWSWWLSLIQVSGVALSGSRIGMITFIIVMVVVVAASELRNFFGRRVFWLTAVYLLASAAAAVLSENAGATRLNATGLSTSRWDVWMQTFELISMHPYWGVGWGDFNFAWVLEGLHKAIIWENFDHTHNLFLQITVELGLPFALAWCAGLVFTCWRLFYNIHKTPRLKAAGARLLWLLMIVVIVFSQTEFPLWYPYFLFPFVFVMGYLLDLCAAHTNGSSEEALSLPFRPLVTIGLLMTFSSLLIARDYLYIAPLFNLTYTDTSLQTRYDEALRSKLFARPANYAVATSGVYKGSKHAAAAIAAHGVIDAALLKAWAKTYAKNGELEKARFLTAKVKSYPEQKQGSYFAICSEGGRADEVAYRCIAPSKVFSADDFRD